MPVRAEGCARRTARAACWFTTFALAYVLSVASDDVAELCYATLFGAGATALVLALHARDRRSFAPRARAIVTTAARTATGALSETWLLLGPHLFSQLSGRAEGGRFVRIAIDRNDESAEDAGRVACVLWASSFTPNALPLFIDRKQLVLHQLVRRREPHADDAEFPI